MADNTDLLNQIRAVVRDEVAPIKATQQEQGKKLDEQGKEIKAIQATQQEQGKKLDQVIADQGHIKTTLKALEGTIKETKEDVDEIKRRQRPQKVD